MDFCATVDVLFGPVTTSPTVWASLSDFGLCLTVNVKRVAMIITCVQYVLNIRALLA